MIAWVGLGGNLGAVRDTLARACAELDRGPTRLQAVSGLYASRPLGPQDQPDFLNAVVRVASARGPAPLLARLKEIEAAQGRLPRGRWRERELDLDLLLAEEDGAVLARGPELELPHAGICLRAFVLAPLLELDPDATDPRGGRRLSEDWAHLRAREPDAVRRMEGPEWCRIS